MRLSFVMAALLAAAGPASSQQGEAEADPFAGVEEMLVTGAGMAGLLAPDSTSAIAFDAGALEAYGVEDLSDIAAYVPNLEIRSQNATNASFFIRGVGLQDFGANASSSVPIFQDGIARNPSATQLVGLFDIAGLTVLKGPQGSGNFRNASAGVFVIKTVKPEPEFSGFAKVTIATITSADARDANRYDVEGAMNAPVFEDIVSARISGRYSHEKPFWENGCANRTAIADRSVQRGGVHAPYAGICGENIAAGRQSQVTPYLPHWIGEVDDYAIRGQIRIQPPDSGMDWVFRGEFSNLNRDSTAGQHLGVGGAGAARGVGQKDNANYRDPDIEARSNEIEANVRAANPGFTKQQVRFAAVPILQKELLKTPLDHRPYRGDLDRPGKTLLETYSASMTGLFDFDDFDAELNFGYLEYEKSEVRDTDLSPNVRFPSSGEDKAWEVYGDLSLKGETLGDLVEWQTGLYTLTERVKADQDQQVSNTLRQNSFTQEIKSFGIWAEARYEFLESFTLSMGLRYNWERKEFEVERTTSSTFGVPFTVGSKNQLTWDAVTGFGNIRYEFTEDIATYLRYTRGFKAGHFNPSRANQAKNPDGGFADPEKIDAIEWGLEYGFWDSRIRGSGAIFFYNYRDYQVFRLTTRITGVFREIQNSEKARNFGAELDLTITPLEGIAPEEIEGLSINFRGGWLDTNFVEFTNAEQRSFGSGNNAVTIDYSGNPLISAPNLQASVTVVWPLLIGRFGTLTPQYDMTWTDDTPFDPNRGRGEVDNKGQSRFPSYLVGNRAYTLHNVRLSWVPQGESGLRVSGWCRNVTDERYKTFAVDISTFNSQMLTFVADPRTCGADIRFNF